MVAYIPFDRVEDFKSGQTCADGSLVEWVIADRIVGIEKARPQVDSYIEHIYYECAFGPKDHKGDLEHPHSKKRGCIARFSIKQLSLYPHIAEVAYYHVDHTREDGTPAHGLEDNHSIGRKSAYQPRISKELKGWIKKQLSKGFTAKQVYEEHRSNWIGRRKMKCSEVRDDFAELRDIAYYENRLKMGVWRRHQNDFESVKMWALEQPENVFMWHEKDDVTDLPFILGIQTPWQKEMMLKYGHNRAIALDATFGTNMPKYPLFSLLVFDDWRNGIPVAWVLTSRMTEEDIVMWLEPLRRHLQRDKEDFLPSCFIVDDADYQRNAVKRAWPEDEVPIYLCCFHVLKNWKNHIWTKVPNLGTLRDLVYRQLHSLMYTPIEYKESEEDFLKRARHMSNTMFQFLYVEKMEHYIQVYYDHQEMYLIGHRQNPHSNQDTQSSIESYHAALKRWMKVDNHQLRGRRVDFLVWRLTTPVVSHYMYNQGRKLNGFVLNKRVQKTVAEGIAKAKAIPFDHIRRHHTKEGEWQVQSQAVLGRWYDIPNPYTTYASCMCKWGIRGNMCKHQLAILKSSTDITWGVILEFLGTYYGSMRGGLDAMFEHSIAIDPFEDIDVDEGEVDTSYLTSTMRALKLDGASTSEPIGSMRQTQPSIEGCLSMIDKLVEEAKEEAIEGGIELVQHMQAMMTKTLTDVRRIRAQQASDILHPQTVFEVVDDGAGNSVIRKKDFREQAMAAMSSQKKRKQTGL